MRLIDAEDYLYRERPVGLSDELYEESHLYKSIMEQEVIQAIPLDRIKQAREEIHDLKKSDCSFNCGQNDRGCDGGCVVNEDMYKKVMDTIKNQMFSQPTSDDCVSRQAVIAIASDSCLDLDNYEDTKEFCDEIRELPPVTPTHGTCKDCRHYYMDEDGHGYHCEKFDYTRFPVYADFYCADFEKRGGENE